MNRQYTTVGKGKHGGGFLRPLEPQMGKHLHHSYYRGFGAAEKEDKKHDMMIGVLLGLAVVIVGPFLLMGTDPMKPYEPRGPVVRTNRKRKRRK